MSLAEKQLFLLDMDGTIYLSETLFDGTLEFLRYVRAIGGPSGTVGGRTGNA